jgi:hypothetical protein
MKDNEGMSSRMAGCLWVKATVHQTAGESYKKVTRYRINYSDEHGQLAPTFLI